MHRVRALEHDNHFNEYLWLLGALIIAAEILEIIEMNQNFVMHFVGIEFQKQSKVERVN